MVLNLSHVEGGFGVTFNDVTKDVVFYTEHQVLWLPKDDLQDPSSWSSSPLLILRDIRIVVATVEDSILRTDTTEM